MGTKGKHLQHLPSPFPRLKFVPSIAPALPTLRLQSVPSARLWAVQGMGSGCSSSSLLLLPCCCLSVPHRGASSGLSPFRSVPLTQKIPSTLLTLVWRTLLLCSSLSPWHFLPFIKLEVPPAWLKGSSMYWGRSVAEMAEMGYVRKGQHLASSLWGHPCSLSPHVFQLELRRGRRRWGGCFEGALGVWGLQESTALLWSWLADQQVALG